MSAVRDFTDDVSTAWARISKIGAPYYHGLMKASGIFPALLYLHAIASHTLAGHWIAPGNVTQTKKTFLLAYINIGITMDMGRFITLAMRGFMIDTQK